jgi:nucleoside 2-deoxyribosyltransferase
VVQSDGLENRSPVREAQVQILYPPLLAGYIIMIITICGSMQFHMEMAKAQKDLEAQGFRVLVPTELGNEKTNESFMSRDEDKILTKIEYDFIREHFRKIEKSDAILVLNYKKKDIAGYIGGNTFLEMGYAFGLRKKIYLFYPVPKMDYSVEMHAMKPVVLNGDLSKLL